MYLRAGRKLQREVSIDESIGTDREGNNMTFSDILTADCADFADIISDKLEAGRLYSSMKRVLTPDEIKIICWRYGLGGTRRRTQKEIADIMGISRSYVSRIEKRCIEKLAAEMRP